MIMTMMLMIYFISMKNSDEDLMGPLTFSRKLIITMFLEMGMKRRVMWLAM